MELKKSQSKVNLQKLTKNPNIDNIDNQHLPAFLVGSGILNDDFPFTECLCF